MNDQSTLANPVNPICSLPPLPPQSRILEAKFRACAILPRLKQSTEGPRLRQKRMRPRADRLSTLRRWRLTHRVSDSV